MRIIYLILLLQVCTIPINAQNDKDCVRRFSIDGHIGALHAGRGTTMQNGQKASDYEYGEKTPTGFNTKLHVEYYLPRSEWSVKGGYESGNINFLGGDAEIDLQQLMLGTRWYPSALHFWEIQPYVGADALWHVGERSMDGGWMSAERGTFGSYRCDISGHLPTVSMGPVVGFDLKLFTSVDIAVEYGYRWGIDGRIDVQSKYQRDAHAFQTRLHPHRGVFSIGLKIDFPFRWRSTDSRGFLDGIFNLIDSSIDDKYDRRMREQRDARQYERTKSLRGR